MSDDSFETSVVRCDKTVLLKLPKFSKGYGFKDFISSVEPIVSDWAGLGRLKYPNEWTLTVKSAESRFKLLKKGVLTVKGKKCVVYSNSETEVCGKIHWLPHDVPDDKILIILRRFGDILFIEKEKDAESTETQSVETNVRFFVMQLKPNVTKESVPHFLKIGQHEGLVTIKGREPLCFKCKGEHRKYQCTQRNVKFLKKEKIGVKPKAESKSSSSKPISKVAQQSSVSSSSRPAATASGSSETKQVQRSSVAQAKSAHSNLDPNLFQNFIDLSQKLVEMLNADGGEAAPPSATAASASAAPEEAKSKKKKKKKKKKNTAAAATNHLEAGENSDSDKNSENVQVVSAVEEKVPVGNPPAPSNGQKKKKKKKNNKSAAATSSKV